MASKYAVQPISPVVHELRIVLWGHSIVGKSTTGNIILGREAFRETETTECEIQRGSVDSRNISVIDTPGINNRLLTEECKRELKRCLSLSAPGPHVFLLVIRLRRFTEDGKNTVKWIQENMGEEALRFTMVLFTGKEEMTNRQWTIYYDNNRIQEFVGQFGGGYAIINSKREANPAQITKLLEQIDTMVQCNGGQYYTEEMYQEVQRKISMEEEKKRPEKERKKREEEIMRQEKERKKREEEIMRQEKERKRREEEIMRQEKERTSREQIRKGQRVQIITKTQCIVHMPSQRERRSVDDQALVNQGATGQNVPSFVSDLRIVLLGAAGSGRTASGNTILGRKVFVDKCASEFLSSRCQTGYKTVEGTDIWVIDTPGISHTSLATDDWNTEIKKCLSPLASGSYVFLLVINLAARFRKDERNIIKWIEENFGEEASLFTIVLFTHIDQIRDRTMHEFFIDNPELRELVASYGNRYHTFNNKDPSRSQARQLMEKIDGMIKANPGQHYTFVMYQEVQRKKREQEQGFLGSLLSGIQRLF